MLNFFPTLPLAVLPAYVQRLIFRPFSGLPFVRQDPLDGSLASSLHVPTSRFVARCASLPPSTISASRLPRQFQDRSPAKLSRPLSCSRLFSCQPSTVLQVSPFQDLRTSPSRAAQDCQDRPTLSCSSSLPYFLLSSQESLHGGRLQLFDILFAQNPFEFLFRELR
jgi:hypothetical protein